ncbi:hypothetical protein B0H11DRAFT_1943458 [Mycena galericulata]|nr:hypothetical protein B0H11DRAFT_1943458 [Mycena galericulata]
MHQRRDVSKPQIHLTVGWGCRYGRWRRHARHQDALHRQDAGQPEAARHARDVPSGRVERRARIHRGEGAYYDGVVLSRPRLVSAFRMGDQLPLLNLVSRRRHRRGLRVAIFLAQIGLGSGAWTKVDRTRPSCVMGPSDAPGMVHKHPARHTLPLLSVRMFPESSAVAPKADPSFDILAPPTPGLENAPRCMDVPIYTARLVAFCDNITKMHISLQDAGGTFASMVLGIHFSLYILIYILYTIIRSKFYSLRAHSYAAVCIPNRGRRDSDHFQTSWDASKDMAVKVHIQ